MSKESCGNCRFFHGYPGARWDGTCRKSHPVSIVADSTATFPAVLKAYYCGEWRSKAAAATGKLYQLPNGQHIHPDDVRGVATLKGGYSSDARADLAPRVQVRLCDHGLHIIPCDTLESAEAMRDKIADDVNAMVWGA